MTPINSIAIPDRFVEICEGWYDGMGDMLYAVSSTGALTTGTRCPIDDYNDLHDRSRKWYYSLWCDLSVDVGRAARSARSMGPDNAFDAEVLGEFEEWVDNVCDLLAEEYGLEDWLG
jgi:hypothetical protein